MPPLVVAHKPSNCSRSVSPYYIQSTERENCDPSEIRNLVTPHASRTCQVPTVQKYFKIGTVVRAFSNFEVSGKKLFWKYFSAVGTCTILFSLQSASHLPVSRQLNGFGIYRCEILQAQVPILLPFIILNKAKCFYLVNKDTLDSPCKWCNLLSIIGWTPIGDRF